MKPMDHARSSAVTFGGKAEDYLDIHLKMDCSKSVFGDLRHRALTHHPFWIDEVIVPIFGEERLNSDGDAYSVRDVAEQHIMEDFRGHFIPAAADYLVEMEFPLWMNNADGGAVPPSRRKVAIKDDSSKGEKLSPHTGSPLLVVPLTKKDAPPRTYTVVRARRQQDDFDDPMRCGGGGFID